MSGWNMCDCWCPVCESHGDGCCRDAAPTAPESYVRQHRTTSECWCGPEPVGFSGAWLHRKVDE